MTTPREIIAKAFVGLYAWGDSRADVFAEQAVQALTASGRVILSKAEVEAIQAEERERALLDAARAYEAHDKAGREWINGSLYDTLNREGAARIRALKSGGAP